MLYLAATNIMGFNFWYKKNTKVCLEKHSKLLVKKKRSQSNEINVEEECNTNKDTDIHGSPNMGYAHEEIVSYFFILTRKMK